MDENGDGLGYVANPPSHRLIARNGEIYPYRMVGEYSFTMKRWRICLPQPRDVILGDGEGYLCLALTLLELSRVCFLRQVLISARQGRISHDRGSTDRRSLIAMNILSG